MANISLRAYYREVEELIGQGRIDEVIAHCRQMLKFFPKDVTVYRLLAKAYLETQRFSDATDIFQRVLSVIPDDFVSHVGMSIIREDEGNLDAAIWHMERAFEVQPSNSAIRDELRRLFGKRDGLEPPKIRLSRGALARMYAQGNLYQQSIGELRAALADEPTRFDLQTLLARMYLLNGNNVESAELCNLLLNKLPFCLEGNRILGQILVEGGRAPEADTYHQRVQMLDPYAAHVTPDSPDTDEVPDHVVSLVRLDYDPGEAASATDSQPGWAASLGISLEEEKPQTSELPSWLADEESEADQQEPEEVPTQVETPEEVAPAMPMDDDIELPTSPFFNEEVMDTDMDSQETIPPDDDSEEEETPKTGDLIPDWMKDAGWATSDSETPSEEAGTSTDELDFSSLPDDQAEEEGEIEAGEIPEWLQDMAPQEIKEAAASMEDDDQMSGEIPPWLSSRPPGPTDSVVMWLQNKPEEEGETPTTGPLDEEDGEPLESVEVPDWLQSVAAKMPVAEAAEAMQQSGSAEQEPEEDAEQPRAGQEPEAHPDWLGQPAGEAEGSEPSIEDTQPTQKTRDEAMTADETVLEFPVQAESEPEPEQPEEVPAAEPEPAVADQMPDWLGGIEDQEVEVATPVAELGEEEEEVPDWLQELEADVPTVVTGPAEEPVSSPEEVAQVELPDWLTEAAGGEEAPVEQIEAMPGELEAAGADESEEFAYREVPTEEIPAGEAMEPTPSWMEAADTPEWEQPEPMASMEAEAEPEPVADEQLPPWLTEEQADEMPAEMAAAGELDQFPQTEDQDNLPSLEDQDAAIAWLESLAAKQGAAEEELITDPEDRREAPPEWVTESMDEEVEAVPQAFEQALPEQPDWMTDTMMSETVIPEEGGEAEEWAADTLESETTETEIPEWIRDTAQTEEEGEAPSMEIEEGELAQPQPPQTRELSADWMLETGLPDEFFGDEEDELEGQPEAESEVPPWAREVATPDIAPPVETEDAAEVLDTEAEMPIWARETIESEEDQPELEATETLPTPAGTKELNADWMLETELPDDLFGSEPSLEQAAEALEGTPEAYQETPSEDEEALAEKPSEPSLPQAETRELESEWMLDTALPDSLFEEAEPPDADLMSELTGLVERAELDETLPEPAEASTYEESADEPAIAEPAVEEERWFEEPAAVEQPSLEAEVAEVTPAEEMPQEYATQDSISTAETLAGPSEEMPAELAAAAPVQDKDAVFEEMWNMGKTALSEGNITEALDHYNQLIRRRKKLDLVIENLKEAVYRFPVDTDVLESLGDAYARSSRLQDALDSYTKAEELLR